MQTHSRITNYRQTFFPRYSLDAETLKIIIRMYYLDNKPYYLAINPFTFETEASPGENFKPRKVRDKTPRYFTFRELLETPYMKALTRYTSNEPEGIEKIMPLLHDSNFHWLPLNEAFAK